MILREVVLPGNYQFTIHVDKQNKLSTTHMCATSTHVFYIHTLCPHTCSTSTHVFYVHTHVLRPHTCVLRPHTTSTHMCSASTHMFYIHTRVLRPHTCSTSTHMCSASTHTCSASTHTCSTSTHYIHTHVLRPHTISTHVCSASTHMLCEIITVSMSGLSGVIQRGVMGTPCLISSLQISSTLSTCSERNVLVASSTKHLLLSPTARFLTVYKTHTVKVLFI